MFQVDREGPRERVVYDLGTWSAVIFSAPHQLTVMISIIEFQHTPRASASAPRGSSQSILQPKRGASFRIRLAMSNFRTDVPPERKTPKEHELENNSFSKAGTTETHRLRIRTFYREIGSTARGSGLRVRAETGETEEEAAETWLEIRLVLDEREDAERRGARSVLIVFVCQMVCFAERRPAVP